MSIFRGRTDRIAGLVAVAGALSVGAITRAQDTAPAQPLEPPTTREQPREAVTPPDGASLRFRMDEVIVTATRSEHTGFDTPYATDIVEALRIRERSYRTTPEALRDIPGIMVQKTSHGQGAPFIRGFTGFRTVFLIDGVRLNNSVFRDGPNQYWNTVDPLSLARLEIVKGPSSVLYGSDAIGGTVAAFTKNPSISGDGFNIGGRTQYRFSSAERSHVGRAEISFSHNDTIGALIGLSLKGFGDVVAGSPTNRQPNTGYDEYDFDAKAEVWISDTARIVMAHQTVRQNDVPRTHRTIFSKPFAGTTVGTDLRRDLDQSRDLTYVQLRADGMDGAIDALRLNLSWQRQKETRHRIKGSGSRDVQGFDLGALGMWGQFTSETAVGRLTYGAEWYRDFVDSFSSKNTIQGPVADDAIYDLLGVYLQDEIELGERTAVVLGGRFNYARADADSVQDPQTGNRISIRDAWSSFVGSARVTHSLIPEHLNLFGGVSQGFRAPNLSDLTRLDSARTNEIETPSPGLNPERFLSTEIGLKTRGDWWAAQASYFHTGISDLIIRTPTGAVIGAENEVTKRNSGNGFVQGVEFGASVRPHPQWTVFGHIAWLGAAVDSFPTSTAAAVREPISRLMPLNGQIGLRFDHPSERFWVEGMLTLADRADRLSSRDRADTSRIPPGGTPGYEVFSIRSGWRVRDNVTVSLALENLTDADYRIHGSGQNEPGRSVVVGVELSF